MWPCPHDRFSEDIDLVVYRDGLGFEGETRSWRGAFRRRSGRRLSRNSAWRVVDTSVETCKPLWLRGSTDSPSGCLVVPDEVDVDGQTLYTEYPTLFPIRFICIASLPEVTSLMEIP